MAAIFKSSLQNLSPLPPRLKVMVDGPIFVRLTLVFVFAAYLTISQPI